MTEPLADSIADSVAAEIRAEIGRQRIALDELAARSGMSRYRLMRRLSGATPLSVDELQRIATTLGREPVYFLAANST